MEKLLEQAHVDLAESEKNLARLRQRIDGANTRIDDIRSRLASDEDVADIAHISIDSMPLAELERLLLNQQEKLSSERAGVVELDSTLSELLQSTAQTAGDYGKPNRTADSVDQVADKPADKLSTNLDALKLREIRLKIAETEDTIAQLNLSQNQKLTALATAERDLLRKALVQREAFIRLVTSVISELRKEVTARSLDQARESRRQIAFEPRVIRELADETVLLHEELSKVSTRNGNAQEELQKANQSLEHVRDDFGVTRERVKVVGSSPAVGRMLRRRLASLPSDSGYRRNSADRQHEINSAIDRQIDIDEILREQVFENNNEQLLFGDNADSVSAEERRRQVKLLHEFTIVKRDSLTELHAEYGALAATLTQVDQAQLGRVNQARKYVAFIEGQLMTIPSGPSLHRTVGSNWTEALNSLFSVTVWRGLYRDVVSALESRLSTAILLCAILIVILFVRLPVRRVLRDVSAHTNKVRSDSMALTYIALACSTLLALFWPLLIGGFGWTISHADISDISHAFGTGMTWAGSAWLLLGFAWQICQDEGLGMRHFRWAEGTCSRVRRNLSWLLPSLAALVAASQFTYSAGIPHWDLISRILFLGSLALVILFFWQTVMNSASGSKEDDENTGPADTLSKGRKRWFAVIFLVLLCNGILSYAGYHYTAMKLSFHISGTAILLMGLLLMYNMLLRWSVLVQRRLRFQELVRRRQEARVARQSMDEDAVDDKMNNLSEEPDIDLASLGEQTRRVIYFALVFTGLAGLYLIWEDLFPALHLLDEIKLPFNHRVVIDGIETEVPVTLTNLVVGVMVIISTFIAARNLPGLLEFTLLQRLPIDAGARYAIISIVRYLIVAIGVVVAFGMVGADWSKLQWLVAALGVGLGFGLQEIVANFISGIILLFERPIRVGDTITLGDTDGTVTRIRIRATTIRNWDQRELVVPNKEFITGRLLNWTLSDNINRMVVTIGVAYGSDVDKALQIMQSVARAHPNILDEPKPVIAFEAFGESSLDLSLRCYMSGIDHLVSARTQINTEINKRFTEAGIEIPFAQRDVNLHASEPVPVRLSDGNPGAA